MKTTGLFTTHRVEIECELNKPIKLIPFGDVHRDSDLHCDRYWNEFLDYAKSQENAIFLGIGDYTDGVSTSERIILTSHGLHETTRASMVNMYKGVTETLYNELSFMKGKCIGLLGGNHYFDFGDGDTTDHILAAKLNTKFLGVCSFIRLSFLPKRANGKNAKGKSFGSLDIFCHHGKGGGQLAGSTFNTVEKMQNIADADIYLMGHDHKKGCIPASPKLKLTCGSNAKELTVKHREPWLGRTGSFLKAYEPGCVGYNVDAGRSACALGWIEFEITPKEHTRTSGGRKGSTYFQIRGTA